MWKGRVGKKHGLWVHPDLTHVLLITSLLPWTADTALDTSAKWAYYTTSLGRSVRECLPEESQDSADTSWVADHTGPQPEAPIQRAHQGTKHCQQAGQMCLTHTCLNGLQMYANTAVINGIRILKHYCSHFLSERAKRRSRNFL